MKPRTAIITGAGGALAQHLITQCRQAGWKLALVAHSDAGRERLQKAYPDSLVVQADLADATQSRTALVHAADELGGVDCLFNIAGGFAMADAVDTDPEAFEAQLSINFRTAFNATRAVLPGMLERGHGFVLGVGAAAAFTGGAMVGAYAASKAALVAWLNSVRQETAGKGVAVAIIHPMSAIDTPANRKAMPDTDPAQWIDPDELAATMLHLATRGPRGHLHEAKVYPPA